MTVTPDAPTTMPDMLLDIYAGRLEVSTRNPVVVEWLHRINAHTVATGGSMPILGKDVAPFDGSPTPQFLDGTTPAAPVVPSPVAAAEPLAETAVTTTGVPWVKRYEVVMFTDIQGRSPEHLLAIIKMRSLRSRKRGDIAVVVTELERVLGVKRSTIKTWFKPGGTLADVIVLRDFALGGHITATKGGAEMWLFDILTNPVLVPKVDADGQPVLDDDGKPLKQLADPIVDRHVEVPRGWFYAHPDTAGGDEWTAAPWTAGAIWAAIAVKAMSKGKAGKLLSRADISAWSCKDTRLPRIDGLPRVTADTKPAVGFNQTAPHLAAAEDAGLITVPSSRSGRVRAFRRWHTIPITDKKLKTSTTRRKAYKGHDTNLPADQIAPVDLTVEPPF